METQASNQANKWYSCRFWLVFLFFISQSFYRMDHFAMNVKCESARNWMDNDRKFFMKNLFTSLFLSFSPHSVDHLLALHCQDRYDVRAIGTLATLQQIIIYQKAANKNQFYCHVHMFLCFIYGWYSLGIHAHLHPSTRPLACSLARSFAHATQKW